MKQTIILAALLLLTLLAIILFIPSFDISDSVQEPLYVMTSAAVRNISEDVMLPVALTKVDESTAPVAITFEKVIADYDFSLPVPESRNVGDSYFKRCVFIGDSRMLGLIRYTGIEPVNYCGVGLSIATLDSKAFVKQGDDYVTILEALRQNTDFDALYISTGINELGWGVQAFEKKYDSTIKEIKNIVGSKPIYIQLIMPVTTEFENSAVMNPFGLSNNSVESFNNALIRTAENNRIFYLDCSHMFTLDDGSLDPSKSTDGAHLTVDAYSEQLEYYKTHVAGA